MTAVILLGDITGTGALNGAAAEGLGLTQPDSADLEPAFLEVVRDRLHQAGGVLMVYPAWSWRQRAGARLVQIARGALATDHVAGLPLNLPPLALSLVADQLASLAPYVAPGVLAGVADRLPRGILAGAWVRSVAGLRHVRPSLSAHLASFLPGGFMVTAAPAAGVHRVARRSGPATELGGISVMMPDPPATLIVADRGGDTRWPRHSLFAAVAAGTVGEVPPQPAGTEFWGTRRHVEFVAFGSDPRALSAAARSTACLPCSWCGEPTPADPCLFCGTSRDRPSEPATQSTTTP
jgi:hypothetical protein